MQIGGYFAQKPLFYVQIPFSPLFFKMWLDGISYLAHEGNNERLMMEGDPKGLLLRRRHVLDLLCVVMRVFHKWTRCGLLRPVYLGGPQPFYLKTEVQKMLREATDEREGTDQEN